MCKLSVMTNKLSLQGEWAWTSQLLTRPFSWTVTSTLRMTCRLLHAAIGLVRTGDTYEGLSRDYMAARCLCLFARGKREKVTLLIMRKNLLNSSAHVLPFASLPDSRWLDSPKKQIVSWCTTRCHQSFYPPLSFSVYIIHNTTHPLSSLWDLGGLCLW